MRNFALFLLGVALALPAYAQKIVTYPEIPGMKTSADYSLVAGGKPVWVEQVGPDGMEGLHVANPANY